MTQRVNPANQPQIEAAFRKYHREHPETYASLVRISRRLKRQGWDRFGIATVYEVARYRSMLDRDQKGPKLNNNFRSYYSRLIMEREPDLAGVFKTRKLAVSHHQVP